tara:strand:+ start:26630 stop:26827 length:198 start_codon:yes stop_codon:yes gene_type:complete
MKNLLRISIVAYIITFFNTHNIEIGLSSVGYSLIAYTLAFNGCKWLHSALNGKTHAEIKRAVLNG